ncbi:MAG: hypothetical protein R3E14_06075 [Erythrobacter sp.]
MIGFAERRRQAPVKVPEISAHRMPWRALHDAHSAAALVLPWVAFALLLGWTMRGQIAALAIEDPDDAMRLLQVRAWLAGQSWWDVTNYRAGGPSGFSMHWSRLVDVPIAALILFFDVFLRPEVAERLAIAVLPPLQLLIALFILRSTLRCLGFQAAAANIVLLVVPLLSLAVGNMVPMKIDHHAWQALCALGIFRLMVDRRHMVRQTLLAGALGALLVTTSVEGLPFLAAVCAVYAILYIQDAHDRGLALFLGSLALAAPLLFLATIHPSLWSQPRADAVGWPHLAGFALAAIAAWLLTRRQKPPLPILRLVFLSVIALAGALPVLLAFGLEGIAPFGRIDPLVKQYWLNGIQEVRPVFRLLPDAAVMLGWMVVLYVLALATQARKQMSGDNVRGWFIAFALAGLMLGLSLVVFRIALLAQLLMTPLLAAMLYDTLRTASRFDSAVFRVLGTALAIIALSPTAGSLAGKAIVTQTSGGVRGSSEVVASSCDLSRLASLPKGRMLTSIDIAPGVMLRTAHSTVAAPYHRNQAALRKAILAFTSPGDEAPIHLADVDLVMICKGTPDTASYAAAGEDSLAAMLLADRAPRFLEPVVGFDTGALRVWRVR